MKAVLDACVLFPTVTRRLLLGAAGLGAFEPVWSPRLLEEWARACRRYQDGSEARARIEIALLNASWPKANVSPGADLPDVPDLPDANDRHVVATALAAEAKEIVTLNLRDFPTRILTPVGLSPRHPDGFLLEIHTAGTDLNPIVEDIKSSLPATEAYLSVRQMLKRASLPRLARALSLPG